MVDFPLVPVIATKGAAGAPGGALTDKELDVADDRRARRMRALDRPVRLRMGQRHSRRQHEEIEAAPVGFGEIGEPNPGRDRPIAGLGAVVPDRDLRAAIDERADRRQTRSAEAEDGDFLTAQRFDRGHRHLSLSEARPTIARTKAMIQKRITICASDQPSCSK